MYRYMHVHVSCELILQTTYTNSITNSIPFPASHYPTEGAIYISLFTLVNVIKWAIRDWNVKHLVGLTLWYMYVTM